MELADAVAPVWAAETRSSVIGSAPFISGRPLRRTPPRSHTVTTSFPRGRSRLLCRAAKEVNMVDPLEAKRLAEEQLRIIRQRESEAVSGAGHVEHV